METRQTLFKPHDLQLRLLRLFFFYFILSCFCIILFFSIFEFNRFSDEQQQRTLSESLHLKLATTTMTHILQDVVTNLRILAHSQIMANYLQAQTPTNTQQLQKEFVNFARHASLYDQIRFIDASGQEQVRVNWHKHQVITVDTAELQNKAERYYFRHAINLGEGQIYLSQLDLNMERGELERPYKPMLRFATALYRPHSEKAAGILILNYQATHILAAYQKAMLHSWGSPMLLNAQSYWLYSPMADDEWGFMLGHDRKFAQRFPHAWETINLQSSGTVQTDEGLFIYDTFTPLPNDERSSLVTDTMQITWKLVSHIKPETLTFPIWAKLRDDMLPMTEFTFLTGVLSFLLAWTRVKSQQQDMELRASETRFRDLIEQAPDGIFTADLQARYTDVNSAGCQLLGLTRAEIIGKSILDFIPIEDTPRLQQSKERLLQGKVAIDEWTLRHKDGSYVPVEVSAKILPDGRWQGFVRNISERQKVEEQMRQATVVFNNTLEAIIIADAKRRIIEVNRAFTDITGYTRDEVIGKNPRLQQSGQHDLKFYKNLWQSLKNTNQWQGEIWNRRKNGELYPAWENISVIRDNHNRIINYVSIFSDISTIKQTEARLKQLAHHDGLTGLDNRLTFNNNLQQALIRTQRHKQKVALLFLDLDRFKLINDTLGHATGDRLLRVVAERLKLTARAQDLIARLGGDEFTIILEEIANAEDAATLAQKIIQHVAEPIQLDGQEIATSTSIGISIYPDDASNAADLAKAADTAMYRAKALGRHTYQFYTSELTALAEKRFTIESELRLALERDELVLFYQPQIDVATGRLCGVEALLRWRHPSLGLIMPNQFIRIAEESRLIDLIDDWVILQACTQASRWRNAGLRPLRIAINLSIRQIMYDNTVKSLQQALQKNQLRSSDVLFEIEVTENILQSGKQVSKSFQQLRQLGVSIAIDDFGTGYSSLSYLKYLPVDTIKVDRSFIHNIQNDGNNKAITTAIISMAHSLGLRVVAEGVETLEQLEFLKQKECDVAQGFLVQEAVDAASIEKLLLQDPAAPLTMRDYTPKALVNH